jgi:capsular polysaccharide biosynthesis protein
MSSAAPLAGLKITEAALDLAPKAARLERAPFPLLDLRTRPEEHPPFSGARMMQLDRRFMEQQYAGPVALKPDPMYIADEAAMFGGALWVDGEFVAGSVHKNLVEQVQEYPQHFARQRKIGRMPRLTGTTALVHTPGFRNYFHWMTESLPRFVALRRYLELGLGPLDRILITQPEPKDFVLDSIRTFFPELLPKVELAPTARADLERVLFFLDWRGVGTVHTRIKDTTASFFERIASEVAALPGGAGRALLISRADVDNRRMVNEPALLEAFAPLKLEPVTFTGLPVAAQMRLMAEARLVVGVHGAGLTNAMFCRPGTALLEITSTQYIRRSRSYADIAAFRGFPYAIAVVDQVGENWVVTKNRGNDVEAAPAKLPELRTLAEQLLAAA